MSTFDANNNRKSFDEYKLSVNKTTIKLSSANLEHLLQKQQQQQQFKTQQTKQQERGLMKHYDISNEIAIFDTHNDEQLNESIDLINTRKYMYKPNTQQNDSYKKKKYKQLANTNNFNLYTINNYRTNELSWAVQYMAMQNHHENSNIILVETQHNEFYVNRNKNLINFIYYYYTSFTIWLQYKILSFIDKNSIYIIISTIMFCFILIDFINDFTSFGLKNVYKNETYILKANFNTFISLTPPLDFIVCIIYYFVYFY